MRIVVSTWILGVAVAAFIVGTVGLHQFLAAEFGAVTATLLVALFLFCVAALSLLAKIATDGHQRRLMIEHHPSAAEADNGTDVMPALYRISAEHPIAAIVLAAMIGFSQKAQG